ncbi:hypothetical protein [Halorubellus sp. PRR65]|uniref:hypothetical protein n=1 Tax=Halorubellus sp. PRR65 TaxID=3098148 RepID=UPI002B256CD0|nr:hypothetical protein [Halorubellus sp. PRR65]
MDDWESVAMALQGVCVALGGVAVLADAVGVPGVVDPFVLGGGLFAVGFALGAAAASSRDDRAGVALHVVAVAGWVGVLAGSAMAATAATWSGVALLAAAGVGLCYRALRAWRTDDAPAEAV